MDCTDFKSLSRQTNDRFPRRYWRAAALFQTCPVITREYNARSRRQSRHQPDAGWCL